MMETKHHIRYGSVCSGVEAATLAWAPLGWECKFVSEVEPFPCAVLQQRFDATKPLRPLDPEEASDDADRAMRKAWGNETNKLPDGGTLPNLGDFTKIRKDDYDGDIDLLVGGTPCQDLSIAGQRAGFEGARSGLAIDFVRLAYELGCKWVVWENVPGALSSNGGGDFATLLSLFTGREVGVPEGGFGTAGFVCNARRDRFGLAWRVLDAQYVRVPEFPRAVPQRRRRIFLIGYLGSWEYPVQVLFDGEMRGGYTPPSRTKRQGAPARAESRVGEADAQWWDGSDRAGTLTCSSANQLMPDKDRLQCIVEKPVMQIIDIRQIEVHDEFSPTLRATDYKGGKAVYGIGRDVFNQGQNAKYGMSLSEDVQPTMTSRGPGAVCYENNPTDSRIKETTVSPTCVARWGTGGNNMPLVQGSDGDIASTRVATMFTKNTSDDCTKLIIEQNPIGFIKNDAGGEQQGFWEDMFPTLRSGALPAVAYNVTFCDANGTRKDRPNGGLYVTEAETSKTITVGGTNAETVVVGSVAIAENIIGRQDHTGGNGVGAQEELAYTKNATGVMGVATMECVPLDLRNATRDPNKKDEQNRQGCGVGNAGDPSGTLTLGAVPGVAVVEKGKTVHIKENLTEEIDYGNAKKIRPSEILRVLRNAIGEKAFSEWIGRYGSVSQEEILQSEMHGGGVRCKTVSCEACGITEIPCEEDCPARTMRNLWGRECPGCTPQGSQHSEQRSVESDADMQKLSQQDSSKEKAVCRMWETTEGAWILREALGEIQKIWKSASAQTESTQRYLHCTVRKLLPICCERLMGFPDNHTQIAWKGKPPEDCPDAPRYKACGNSMCCNVMAWIGHRIQEVEERINNGDKK